MVPARNLNDWISTVVEEGNEETKSPLILRRWSAFSAVCGALGRRCWLETSAFTVYPNMYIFLVTPPGRGKGEAIALPVSIAYTSISTPVQFPDDHNDARTEWKDLRMPYPNYMWKDGGTVQRLIEAMSTHNRVDEDLSKGLDKNHYDSSATAVVEEFGVFFKEGDRAVAATLAQMWDAKEDFNDSLIGTPGKKRDRNVKGPCLNLLAGATPYILINNLPPESQEQGFLRRVVIVYYNGPGIITSARKNPYKSGLVSYIKKDLATIAQMKGEFTWEGSEDAPFFQLLDEWQMNKCYPTPPEPLFEGYNGSRWAIIVKMGMAFSASRNNDLIITSDDMLNAIEMLFEAEKYMEPILKRFSLSKSGKTSMSIVDMVKSYYRDNGHGMPLQKFKELLVGHVDSIYLIDTMIKELSEAHLIKITQNKVFPFDKKAKETKVGQETGQQTCILAALKDERDSRKGHSL